MDGLRGDIKKVTSLTSVDEDAKFYRLHGLSQAAKDRKMNERKVKKPKNRHILEDSDTDVDDDCMNTSNSKVKPSFDSYEVSASIKEVSKLFIKKMVGPLKRYFMFHFEIIASWSFKVNGGCDFSNEHILANWRRNVESMSKSEKEISQNSSEHDNTKVDKSEPKDLNDKCIKQKDRLFRNAAIMGLVNTNKISWQDLFSNEDSRKENKTEVSHGSASNEFITDGDKYQVESVPLREDPEIFVHPFLGLDRKKFKDIDFTIPRIGRKTKVTPQKYFSDETDESYFEFVKRKDSTT